MTVLTRALHYKNNFHKSWLWRRKVISRQSNNEQNGDQRLQDTFRIWQMISMIQSEVKRRKYHVQSNLFDTRSKCNQFNCSHFTAVTRMLRVKGLTISTRYASSQAAIFHARTNFNFHTELTMEARVDKQKLCLLITTVMAASSAVGAAPTSMHAFVQKRFGIQAYGKCVRIHLKI